MITLSNIQQQALALIAVDGARGMIGADPKPPTSPRVIATIHAFVAGRHETFRIQTKVIRQLSRHGLVWLDPVCDGDQIKAVSFGVTDIGISWLAIYREEAAFRSAKAAQSAP